MREITATAPATSSAESPAAETPPVAPPRPRTWPALGIIVLMWLAATLPALLAPDIIELQIIGAFNGPMVAGALLAVWWLFFSRVPWTHRFLGLVACVGLGVAAWFAAHPSIGFPVLIVWALPLVLTAWVAWLVVTPFLGWSPRFLGLLGVVLLSWLAWDLLRFTGTTGSFVGGFRPRWELSAEERLLAQGKAQALVATGAAELRPQADDWFGFRGADRDAVRAGVKIATDWSTTPPKELWRRPVGPGWSSFAVVENRVYTQEQLGEDELVTCYDADTGKPVWVHKDATRFWEAIGGAGPRATPTFHDGKIYAQGARGLLTCLDAATGKKLWQRDIVEDSGAKVPEWGFSASPLVLQGVVVTYGGAADKALLGYDPATGSPRWQAGKGGHSYVSPHPLRIDGVEQVGITTENGMAAHDPKTGELLWEHDWGTGGMPRCVQPARVGEGAYLIGSGFNTGTRRIQVGRAGTTWTAEPGWTTRALRPYYNDFVVHDGHLYGFDNEFFACVNAADGKGKWRTRGYGNGQVLLLADQGLLLIVAETGEVALVEASPSGHKEVARIQALHSKTWNHPVVARGKLFVRDGEEAVCYELPAAK